MNIPFRQLIQLTTLDRRYVLFPRSVLDQAGCVISIFQFTKTPSQPVFLTPNLDIQGILGHNRKQIIPHVQIVRTNYIDQDRESNEFILDSLYDKLLVLKSVEELRPFVEKWNITIIPGEEERLWLLKQYQLAGIKQLPVYLAYMNVPVKNGADIPKSLAECSEKVVEVNLNFLWKKIGELRTFANAWEQGELDEHKLAWLNKELELVSPLLIADKGYALKRIREMKYKWIDTATEDVVGMRKAKTLDPIIGYRVYGHFALCVLEVLHDMESGLQVFSCETCGALRKRARESKRKACSKKESKKCFLTRQAERQKRRRIKGKTA